MGFFYKRLQYAGSVNQAERYKKQPLPKSLAILEQEDTTIFVEPDLQARIDSLGNVILERQAP